MGERALEAQLHQEASLLAADIRQSWAGMACAFVISMTGMVGAIIVALSGQALAGAAIAVVDLVALVLLFITDSVSGRRAHVNQPLTKNSHTQQEVESATEA